MIPVVMVYPKLWGLSENQGEKKSLNPSFWSERNEETKKKKKKKA